MAADAATVSRAQRYAELDRRCKCIAIWMFLQDQLPKEEQMNLQQIEAMSTPALVELYNKLTGQQVKRMATREAAIKRTTAALKEHGQWEEGDAPAAEATVKAPEQPGKAAAAPKAGKGTGKAGKAPESAADVEPELDAEPKRRRGAPTKSFRFIAKAPSDPDYNPKNLRLQAKSDRAVVLEYIQSEGGFVTRDMLVEKFGDPNGNKTRNWEGAIYFLLRYGFINKDQLA